MKMNKRTSIHEAIMNVMKERVVLFYPERQMLVYCRNRRLKVRGYRYSEEIDLGGCTLPTALMFCTLFGIEYKDRVFEEQVGSYEQEVD